MEIQEVALSKIKPYEKNPRINDKAVDKVAESLKEFGWQQPIVVDKDGIIIVGHTRFKAAQKLGMQSAPVVFANNLSKKQVRAYRIADNKVADYSIWDNKLLLEELDGLDDIFTGFEEGDVFNDLLDESDNSVLEENEYGVEYSITFKSCNREDIDAAISSWKGLFDV